MVYATVFWISYCLEPSHSFSRPLLQLLLFLPVLHGLILLLSTCSYLLAVIHPLGFEVALGIHILFAVLSAMVPLKMVNFHRDLVVTCFCAVFCCACFVFLKLLDHQIPLLWNLFSGHFFSKIGDFMQIHFSLEFFLCFYQLLTLTNNQERKKTK